MKDARKRTVRWAFAVWLTWGLTAAAQQPKVGNTQFGTEALSGPLGAAVERIGHSQDSIWLGYEAAALPGTHLGSCAEWNGRDGSGDDCCGAFQLEDHDWTSHQASSEKAAGNMYVLFRFEHGGLLKIRVLSAGCPLDAGGVAFRWITGAPAQESVAYLKQLALKGVEHSRETDGSLMAIGHHAIPEATGALEEVATSTAAPPHTREQAAFWLGVLRGHEGYLALKRLEAKTDDTGLREKLPFDFSQNSDPAAVDELIRMAKFDENTKVREQSIFWLAQKAGKKAIGAISDAIQNDPETEVKKKAVFALSQLPKEEGVPKLIQVADTNANPEVRKQAIFWLGQSHDPRALEYLEAVLKR